MRAGSGALAANVNVAALDAPHGPVPARDVVSGFGAAMLVRVRFARGEIPLWSLIAPLVMLVALSAALAASAVSGVRRQSTASLPSGSAPQGLAPVSSAPATSSSELVSPAATPEVAPAASEHAAPAEPSAMARVAVSDLPVLAAIPDDSSKLSASEILAIADTRSASDASAARALDAALDRDPGLIREAKTLAEIRRLLDNQQTARIVLGSLAGLPGPVSADILYELWTGTVERNETTELARALLHTKDVRPKASPALAVALELRAAERCEAAKALLPRVTREGDRRAFPLVIKLQRKYGCGANKRADCYPCLRKGDELEAAIKATKERREPRALTRR